MSYVATEIATQPNDWKRAMALAPGFAAQLPRRGERIAAVGCGTSWFMSMAYASLREAAGHGETDAFTASEFNYGRHYDRVLVITRSGTTTEVIDLLSRLKGRIATTVITAVAGSPVTRVADETILIEYVDEQSVVQTRFATTTLALLRASLGEDLTAAIADAEWAVTAPVDELAKAEQISFVGTGWTIALAQEAALKTREAAQFWAEAHPAMDYRHGPISIAQPGRVVWCFGEAPEGLAEEVRATGATFESNSIDPMAHLVLAQRTAVALAENRGLNPDQPRNLTRSIILR